MKKKSNNILKVIGFKENVKISLGFLTLILLLNLTVCFGILFFQIENANKITPKQIHQNTINSIVEVKAYSEDVGESFGTAEFVDKDGYLVTNAHVVTYSYLNQTQTFEKYYIRFASDEDYTEVSLIKYDTNIDIAILKMEPQKHVFTCLQTSDSSKISTGDKIYAIGNSANYGLSMSEGIIGAPLINISYNGKTRSVIQANINITEGNSGGALLDEKGNLIGITTFRTKDSSGNVIYGIAYCVPINTVLEYKSN